MNSQTEFHPFTNSSPKALGFAQPAEWAPHQACWLAWPSHENLWQEDLPAAQQEFIALCHSIAMGEKLEILVPDSISQKAAENALAGLPVRFHRIPFGDIWLRDTAPIFLVNKTGEVGNIRFKFNGWGGKYSLPFDSDVSKAISAAVGNSPAGGTQAFSLPWILEGGSVEVDGEGTCLTSRQCLLNENRNPAMTQGDVEAALSEALGIEKVLWLNNGLLNDHTDGHIDTIARFVAPGVVVCMKGANEFDDPNFEVLEEIAKDLEQFIDAKGRKLQVVRIPSPGKILAEEEKDDGESNRIMPASYLNFYIGNKTVVVPTYGSPSDSEAVARIGELFPTRKTVGLSAIAILTGGGAFHCITQQQPLGVL